LPGKDAETMLADCGRVALLGCTLGAEFESMLRAEQARDMAQAVLLDACGSAWVEAGCDEAEREIAARFPGRYLTDRFSPGYGDLPLSMQPAICGALDLGRRLGVHVSERFLMNPSKSVTALIGIADRPQMARIRGCAYCAMRETCTLRKGGTHCGN
ncbi:MAG: methionine synthase, partial [Oscillospiraceae bacterium]|nr:methionine synthase [Oscillospiraceae bacterium]